jgi:Concanavalin A-like lectin/glucanases superfamily
MAAIGFMQRKAKSLSGEIAALAVLTSVVMIAPAQPQDYLRYTITATTDLTSVGGIKDTGTGNHNGTELSMGKESFIVPGHAAGTFAVFLAGDESVAPGTGIDTGIDTVTAGIDGAAFTVMAWVNRGTVKGDNMVFGTNLGNNPDLYIGFRGAICDVAFLDTNESSGPVFPPFAWHHWAVRYDGTSNQDIFIDGVLVASGGGHNPYDSLRNGQHLFVGRARNGSMAFAGALDDVRLFQQALRNDQIAAIAADLPIPP